MTAVPCAARAAAQALRNAEGILITAGAGIGVDSGLPDFRGVEGLWKEYPPIKQRGLDFADCANPNWFVSDPNFAWGFYGHRLNLYRRTVPHAGFNKMLAWARNTKYGVRVFTSNVDGQFQKAGYSEDDVVECHGSIHWLQNLNGNDVWSADATKIPDVDAEVLSVPDEHLPRADNGEVARPNILMFGDGAWHGGRTARQRRSLQRFLWDVPAEKLVILELGAGLAVPTVRMFGESLAQKGSTLVRINPRDPQPPWGMRSGEGTAISIPLNGLEALELIERELE